jgi:hypothetical protein
MTDIESLAGVIVPVTKDAGCEYCVRRSFGMCLAAAAPCKE